MAFTSERKGSLKDIAQAIKENVLILLEEAGKEIEKKAIQFCPVDTGALRGSIRTNVVGWNEVEVGAFVKHAGFVEFGTAPHMPPVHKLIPWVRRHRFVFGIKKKRAKKGASVATKLAAKSRFENELLDAAWALAKKIEREGTKPQPFLRPAVIWFRKFREGFFQTKVRKVIEKFKV